MRLRNKETHPPQAGEGRGHARTEFAYCIHELGCIALGIDQHGLAPVWLAGRPLIMLRQRLARGAFTSLSGAFLPGNGDRLRNAP